MILLDELGIAAFPLSTVVYRHMLAGYPPDRANTRGARWNPPGIPAIYTSLERETSLMEAEYHLSLQTPRPRVRRTLYRIRVLLRQVIDLREPDRLRLLGLRPEVLAANDMVECQRTGKAVADLGADGLIVPSVRHSGGSNLVIYPRHGVLAPSAFEVIETEPITDAESES